VPFLADTNILLRLAEPSGPDYTIVRTAVETLLARGEHLCYSERVHFEWRRLVVRYSVAGVQVHDARLVASMLVHGVPNLLTLNGRDFARYATIRAVHPGMVSEAG
jgi:predicted nucleic acid-binding protein